MVVQRLREFCLRYKVHFEEEPQLLTPSKHAWIINDVLGNRWVIKSNNPKDRLSKVLKSFSVLQPPFIYPQPVSASEDSYLLYPYVEGSLLAEHGFESPEVLGRVVEVIARLQATMRSLVLAPFFQDTMRLKNDGKDNLDDSFARLSFGRVQGTSERQKEDRFREISESYHWTERKVQACSDSLRATGLCPESALEEYRERMHDCFALHVPVVGTNLSHTSLQPEHFLSSPGGVLGILGWRIEPRPRFYMLYTYLAWSLLHSKRLEAKSFYKDLLSRNSSKAFHTEHHLVFAFCLAEQLTFCHGHQTGETPPLPAHRISEAAELFIECVENTRNGRKGAFGDGDGG